MSGLYQLLERIDRMLTTISQATVQAFGVNGISIGQIEIGPIQIGHLVLTDLELDTAADGAFLRNLVVSVTYNMKLDWKLHIELPGKRSTIAGRRTWTARSSLWASATSEYPAWRV